MGVLHRLTTSDFVYVHYEAHLEDGTEVTSTLKRLPKGTPVNRGNALRIELKNALPGLRSIIPLMSVGDKWCHTSQRLYLLEPYIARTIVIPPELAFGDKMMPAREGLQDVDIPPNSSLVFHVKLMGIEGRESYLDETLQKALEEEMERRRKEVEEYLKSPHVMKTSDDEDTEVEL